ncbi:MAG TPA: glucose 1-dehydrogenase [Ktedonobacteraceae bacterium]|nr:glucose 1-dehydrogenase [Ktedonobacteraceae bacterium]
MSASLANKVAIVTGAARGIGQTTVEALAANGAKVVVNYAHEQELAENIVRQIQHQGGQALAIQGDVGKVRDLEAIFQATIEQLGQPDILINNAGISTIKPLEAITEEDFDREYATNVKGTYFACQCAARHLRAGGCIINFSTSVLGQILPNYSLYASTKGAVEQITRHLAREFGPKGITINAVAPGPTETALFTKGKTAAQIENFKHLSAFDRLGKPEDITKVILFLVSPDAAWITGQVIRVNGGFI